MNNITVYAEDSMQLRESNKQLIGCCRGKLAEWEARAQEQAEALVIAKRNKWATRAIKSALRNARGQCIYYHKLMSALKAGYTIIPAPWQTLLIGARTNRQAPISNLVLYKSRLPYPKPMKLAAGAGRYVGNVAARSIYERGKDDKMVRQYYADGFVEGLDFPAYAAKPRLMNAAQRAAVRKVFDEISVTTSRADPMLIGTIYGANYKRCDFLIVWWLDTSTL